MQRVESLRKRGSGYVEVSRPEQPFPWLAFSFTGDYVSAVDQASDVVMRFVAGIDPTELGDWEVL